MSLSREILAAIEESGVPIPTPQLISEFGTDRPNGRAQVWTHLLRFERMGWIRRELRPGVSRDGANMKSIAYWSKA